MRLLGRILLAVLFIVASGACSFGFIVLFVGGYLVEAAHCDPYGSAQNCRVVFPSIGIAFIAVWAGLVFLFIRLSKRNVQ
jgi:hypothetical protein